MEGSSRDLISTGQKPCVSSGQKPLVRDGNRLSSNRGVKLSDPCRWEAIRQEKVQTFLIFDSFLRLFDLVREMILWDVCRFASEAPAVSPTQVFSRFICPSDVEMKMVSALSSNLHSSWKLFLRRFTVALQPWSSKPEICHAPEAPVCLMFNKAARCSGFAYYAGQSCCSWEDLDFWLASGLSGASVILTHLSRELHPRPGTPRRHRCPKVDL